MNDLHPGLVRTLQTVARGDGLILVLTGAGVSAESGIPTFRGREGYWTVGSENYAPQTMATFAMFQRHPDAVWQWYLYRRALCNRAAPNPGHRALAALEARFGDRFLLVTQNVDGLHLRAGSSPARTYQIHGNVNTMRCASRCTGRTFPVPEAIGDKDRDTPLTDADRAALVCPACGGRARPHVLWFDESYDEEHYRFASTIRAAAEAALLVTAGTSGATYLPSRIGIEAARRGIPIVDVNPGASPFRRLAEAAGGLVCRGRSGDLLPRIAEAMILAAGEA